MPPATVSASAARAREHLLELFAPLVEAAGYDLDDVQVAPAGRRSVVRVTVDADGGIDLDAIAIVSRIVSDALDADAQSLGAIARLLNGSYVLEVSSPGVDRPLVEPRHWRRNIGRLVSVAVAGVPTTGRVLDAGEHSVTLDAGGRRREVPWSELGHGRVQVEFNRDADADHGQGE